MTRALREIPPLGRWTLGLHLAWGLFLLLGFAWLVEGAAERLELNLRVL